MPRDLPADDALVAAMDQVRAVCSTGSSLRKAERLRVRLPLPELTVVTADPEGLRPFTGIVADELNVKAVTVLDVAEAHESDFGISQRLVVNARAAGPRLGRDVQTAIRGSKTGDWSVADDGTVTSGGLALVEGEYTVETVVDAEQAGTHVTAMLPGGGFVVLDTDVSPELEVEGAARDLVRAVQQARRDAGLDVSDRITLEVDRRGVRLPRRARPPRARDRRDPRRPSCRSRPTSTPSTATPPASPRSSSASATRRGSGSRGADAGRRRGSHPVGDPRGVPADDVGRPAHADVLQGGGRQARGVALLAQHDDLEVVVGDAQRGLARRVEAPLEHVALDDEGARQVAVLGPLGGRADVDDDRAVRDRVAGPPPG